MKSSTEFKWSKTRAQCPYCKGWYTRQGIQGHIRFRHPDSKKEEKSSDELRKAATYNTYVSLLAEYSKTNRLRPEVREMLWDMMLLDYLHMKSKGKI